MQQETTAVREAVHFVRPLEETAESPKLQHRDILAIVLVGDVDLPTLGALREKERVEKGRPTRVNVTNVEKTAICLTVTEFENECGVLNVVARRTVHDEDASDLVHDRRCLNVGQRSAFLARLRKHQTEVRAMFLVSSADCDKYSYPWVFPLKKGLQWLQQTERVSRTVPLLVELCDACRQLFLGRVVDVSEAVLCGLPGGGDAGAKRTAARDRRRQQKWVGPRRSS